MLSDKEKRELLEMAASAELRAEFDRLRQSAAESGRALSPDAFIAFLTAMARLAPPPPPRPAPREGRMLL